MRVILTTEPQQPLYGVRAADIPTPEDRWGAAQAYPSLFRDPRCYLAGFLTEQGRADWVALHGYEIVTGDDAGTKNPAGHGGAYQQEREPNAS